HAAAVSCTTILPILRAPRRFYVLLPVKFFARRDGSLWGRFSTCGGFPTRPASEARLRARRTDPRQAGTSRAVGLRLCCLVGQAGSLRPRPEGTRNRPGERSSPARE